ncbi:nuclear transport factor 2 family protein [Paraburkholderia sp. BL25I1N1]|uniref:nuclear transport factor 2 family protein n=1 Tax=Paraburkholderia sp. BL25I1N1 TaxID=1938804 RepID=UPI000D074F71|nr:nuclear transport factor 2 family protein [Paraburkholderia sp. BL25I1N1]PRX92096.1 SnoaL-like protein [Paraburkholderia sp. BL25I1N1]
MESVKTMSSVIDTETQMACVETVVNFMAHFDQGEFEAMEAYLAPNGRWVRAEGIIEGIAGLREFAGKRRSDIRVRHVMTNFRLTQIDEDHVTVRCYVSVYREDAPHGSEPVGLPGPHLVGRYTDELERVGGVWKINQKSVIRDFVRGEGS